MESTSTDVEAESAVSASGDGSGGSAADRGITPGLAVATVVAAAAAGLWIGAAALTANQGFDITDEAYYLLSYRWWSTNFRTFTGVQYMYGPVFEALGYDIAGLRLFRLLTVVGTHLVFGWAFMRWLRQRRPGAPASPLWEIAGVAAILGCGGMVYSWLPLSPGYNDVSILGGLLAASIMLRIATIVDQGTAIPAWVPATSGPVAVAMLLAKWSSAALTLAVVAVVGLIVLAPRGSRELIRVIAWIISGAAITAALIHILVVPLTTALPEMLATNTIVAASTNSPDALLSMYLERAGLLLRTIAAGHAALLLAAVFAVVARGRLAGRLAGVLAIAGLATSACRVVADGAYQGGTINLERYPVGILAAFAVAILVGVGMLFDRRRTSSGTFLLRQEGRRGWAILAMLALLPLTQAAGTGNPVHYMAINAFASWGAIIIVVLTGIQTAPQTARWLVVASAGGAVLLSASIAADGLWSHPYRTDGHARTTTLAAGVPALDSVRLAPGKAQAYSLLHQRLQPYIEPEGRAIMAFDEMAGMVLLLDGRPVGEAWYSALDRERTATGIRAECEGRQPWWGSRPPILMFQRPVSEIEIAALRSCGLVFGTDYRLLVSRQETLGLEIYVPTDTAKGR